MARRGDGYVFQRGAWKWICYYQNGKKIREAAKGKDGRKTDDEKEAEKYLHARVDALRAERHGGKPFITPKAAKITVSELVDALEKDYELRGILSTANKSLLKRARADFGHHLACTLTTEQVDSYIADRLANKAAKATVDRVTQVIGQSFKLAMERRRISTAPRIRRLSEKGNERKVSVTETQLADFLAALPDDGLKDFAQWCAACAMRSGEAKKLTWNMLHGNVLRIPGAICKNAEGRVLPVTGELSEILERRKKARRMDCRFIFHREGSPLNDYRKSVATARRIANLPNGATRQERFVFHSLRSVAATNLIHAGVSPTVAMKVGGWKTDSMLQRYCILSTDDVSNALAQTEKFRADELQRQKAEAQKIVAMK